jgi:methionine-gamma-lyase
MSDCNRGPASGSPEDLSPGESEADLSTRLIHAGESPVASAFPIYQANTVDGIYVRMKNPTVEALEEKMRRVEGGAVSVAMASGMAAVSHTLFGLLKFADRIVAHRSLFIGVQTLLNDFVSRLGIEVVQSDLNSPDQLSQALERPCRLIYFETIGNPGLEVVDAPAVIAAARKRGIMVVVDNTMLTPCLFRPLECGADVVIHSATKYLSGHGDALAGFVTCQDAATGEKVRTARRILGGLLSPVNAFLVMRGMKTLPLRMERHCRNAQLVAEFLERHPRVRTVLYPGLPSAPGHLKAKSFLKGFGGVVSFEPREPFDWKRFSANLKLCRVGMSFGEIGTRVQREGPVRVSVGLEDAGEIIRDLERALGS